MKFSLHLPVWLYPGKAGWHFVTIPKKESEEIKARFGKHRVGWGSVPVTITLGKSTWKTSIFPDKKAGGYLLPLKADVRRKEGFVAGDMISLIMTLRAGGVGG